MLGDKRLGNWSQKWDIVDAYHDSVWTKTINVINGKDVDQRRTVVVKELTGAQLKMEEMKLKMIKIK